MTILDEKVSRHYVLNDDVLAGLRFLPSNWAQMCVTSPPYWSLRDYSLPPTVWGGDPAHQHSFTLDVVPTEKSGGNWSQAVNGRGETQEGEFREPERGEVTVGSCPCGAWVGCLGLEPTVELYVEHIVEVFREVRRVLKDDGTIWVNIGDSYAANAGGGPGDAVGTDGYARSNRRERKRARRPPSSDIKPKDLIGVPWEVAFALRADGWYLRRDIIWSKPNPMPESVNDRPTTAHEYLFLLAKSKRYLYNADAIREPSSGTAHTRGAGVNPKAKTPAGWDTSDGDHKGLVGRYQKPNAPDKIKSPHGQGFTLRAREGKQNPSFSAAIADVVYSRNKRSVWTINTQACPEAHFATFPEALVEPCILAGSNVEDVVLDPFFGRGTTGLVALRLGRCVVGIELNPEYAAMAERNCERVDAWQPSLDLAGSAL